MPLTIIEKHTLWTQINSSETHLAAGGSKHLTRPSDCVTSPLRSCRHLATELLLSQTLGVFG